MLYKFAMVTHMKTLYLMINDYNYVIKSGALYFTSLLSYLKLIYQPFKTIHSISVFLYLYYKSW